jgi:hypothetical protein
MIFGRAIMKILFGFSTDLAIRFGGSGGVYRSAKVLESIWREPDLRKRSRQPTGPCREPRTIAGLVARDCLSDNALLKCIDPTVPRSLGRDVLTLLPAQILADIMTGKVTSRKAVSGVRLGYWGQLSGPNVGSWPYPERLSLSMSRLLLGVDRSRNARSEFFA